MTKVGYHILLITFFNSLANSVLQNLKYHQHFHFDIIKIIKVTCFPFIVPVPVTTPSEG